MSGLFSNCQNLINIDISSFNTKKLKNMSNMFANFSKLQNIQFENEDRKINIENVEDMSGLFSN